jgi:hypothetical protein
MTLTYITTSSLPAPVLQQGLGLLLDLENQLGGLDLGLGVPALGQLEVLLLEPGQVRLQPLLLGTRPGLLLAGLLRPGP